MRYRGKRKDNEKWVEGYYAVFGEHHVILDRGKRKDNEKWWVKYPAKEDNSLRSWEVIPKSVAESTGRLDINDKELFGGDIIRFTFDCDIETHVLTGWLEWNDSGYWQVAIIYESFSTPLFDPRLHEIEKIGNLHDNPELLEKAK